ncbi:hypothetical protein RDV64_11500 [Acuticoccus sp. MNP-M23]|uniref:hypothetical protein n=1 Tax=Acuticoccus sp. MNP-M23 TaxID=3072793 RepID=UPI002814CE73|nr:hypothetical protein [Acuticoccus sp. MNP-M23]WMS44967.1 hypothetical protein RDV64_11500 [Acuticoccus sp. MNP-M23]
MPIFRPVLVFVCLTAGTLSASAQEPRDREYRKAMAACENPDILAARKRVEAVLDTAPAGAAAEAQRMMEEGLAACGHGNVAAGKNSLDEAIEVLAAFSAEPVPPAEPVAAEPAAAELITPEPAPEAVAVPDPGDAAAEEVPWWQFW